MRLNSEWVLLCIPSLHKPCINFSSAAAHAAAAADLTSDWLTPLVPTHPVHAGTAPPAGCVLVWACTLPPDASVLSLGGDQRPGACSRSNWHLLTGGCHLLPPALTPGSSQVHVEPFGPARGAAALAPPGVCRDNNDNCPMWAAAGECNKNPVGRIAGLDSGREVRRLLGGLLGFHSELLSSAVPQQCAVASCISPASSPGPRCS